MDFLTRAVVCHKLQPRFVDAMIKRHDAVATLKMYGYQNLEAFEKAYGRYWKHFQAAAHRAGRMGSQTVF